MGKAGTITIRVDDALRQRLDNAAAVIHKRGGFTPTTSALIRAALVRYLDSLEASEARRGNG
jgi:predicted transcriptional regulator